MCRGGAWTDPKCTDYCWEIDSTQTNRKYDYLVDIGICRSSVVVQRSEWAQKSELDFYLSIEFRNGKQKHYETLSYMVTWI